MHGGLGLEFVIRFIRLHAFNCPHIRLITKQTKVIEPKVESDIQVFMSISFSSSMLLLLLSLSLSLLSACSSNNSFFSQFNSNSNTNCSKSERSQTNFPLSITFLNFSSVDVESSARKSSVFTVIIKSFCLFIFFGITLVHSTSSSLQIHPELYSHITLACDSTTKLLRIKKKIYMAVCFEISTQNG